MTSMAEIPGDLSYTNVEGELLRRFPELEAKVQQEFGSYYDLENERPGNTLYLKTSSFHLSKRLQARRAKKKLQRNSSISLSRWRILRIVNFWIYWG
jgi:hypothetical protein